MSGTVGKKRAERGAGGRGRGAERWADWIPLMPLKPVQSVLCTFQRRSVAQVDHVVWELYCPMSIFDVLEKNEKRSLDSAHKMHSYLCSEVVRSFSRLIIYLLKTIWLAACYFAVIVKYYVRNAWGCSKLYIEQYITNILMERLKPEWCRGLRTKASGDFCHISLADWSIFA